MAIKSTQRIMMAIVIAIVSLPHSAAAQAPPSDGKALYLKNCRQCHGAVGVPSATNKAKYPKIRDLTDATFMATLSVDSLVHVIRHGKGKDMRPFEGKLKDAEILAIAQYVRTLPASKAARTED